MKRIVFALAALLALTPLAWAQTAATPSPTVPPLLSGYGTLSVATSSIAVSTLTAGPNSGAYPTGALSRFYITIRNSVGSANILYVCWFGGTCSSLVGEPLAIGETAVRNLGYATVAPTVISGGTATAIIGW